MTYITSSSSLVHHRRHSSLVDELALAQNLDYLRDRYYSDPEIDDLNKTLLALATYNAGPRRMINLRNEAKKLGYDPNVWFDNVEMVANKRVGRETVQYVANIYKYYMAYRLSLDQALHHQEARERAGIE